jgi:hypothetical protein
MQLGDPLETWQKTTVKFVRDKKFAQVLHEIAPSKAELILQAFKNYFSARNPEFGENYWDFGEMAIELGPKGLFIHPGEHPQASKLKDIYDACSRKAAGASPEAAE